MKKSFGLLFCMVPYAVMLLIRTGCAVLLNRMFAVEMITDYDTYVIYVLCTIEVVYIAVFGFWYYAVFVGSSKDDPRDAFFGGRTLFLLIVLGAAVQMAVSYALYFILSILPAIAEAYSSLLSPLLSLAPAAIIYVGVLSPLGEELIFRGLILGYAKEHAPFYAANVLQAVLFGVFHGNLVQGIYAFLLGLLLGHLVRLSGSVFSGIIFHSALNFAGLYLEHLLPTALPAMVKLVLMVLAAALCVWIVKALEKQSSCQ